MNCGCIERVNLGLADAGSKLETITTPSGLKVPVVLAEPGKSGNPIAMPANHCPFCGVKLETGSVCQKN